jgi:peptidyl-prolyl cis-trans isomerase D
MLQFIHDKMRSLILLCLALVAISFVFFGNWTPNHQYEIETYGSIGGRPIRYDDLQRGVAASQLLNSLTGTPIYASPLGVQDFFVDQTWKRLILSELADKAGFFVREDEVIRFIKKNPYFLNDKGGFAPEKYQQFSGGFLRYANITEKQFEEMLYQYMLSDELVKTFFNGLTISEEEIQNRFEQSFSTVQLQTIELSLEDIKKSLKPTDEELKKYFEAHKNAYTSDESRKVEYVLFPVSSASKEELKKSGEKAFAFTEPFFNQDNPRNNKETFQAQAAKEGIQTKTVTLTRKSTAFIGDSKDARLVGHIFDLTSDAPVSDYIQTEKGFIVVCLVENTEAKPLAYEDAKNEVLKDYLAATSRTKLEEEGKRISQELTDKLAAGTPWSKAISEVKVSAKRISTFVPADLDPKTISSGRMVKYLSQELNPNQVSRFQKTEDGGIIVFMESRTLSADQKGKEANKAYLAYFRHQQNLQFFHDWLFDQIEKDSSIKLSTKLVQELKDSFLFRREL